MTYLAADFAMHDKPDRFAPLVESISVDERLTQRVLSVLTKLPSEVADDFIGDPSFVIALDDFVPGRGRKVWLPSPQQYRSRCVVLKQRLSHCSEEFAIYIIAHELAHAYLDNGGWNEIDDPERAADALADHWGFPKPSGWF